MFTRIKDWYWDRKIWKWVLKEEFERAVEHSKRLSVPERAQSIRANLLAYALDQLGKHGEFEIEITTDRAKYERFRSLVGIANERRVVIYESSPGLIDLQCLDEVVLKVLPYDNPLLQYLRTLGTT